MNLTDRIRDIRTPLTLGGISAAVLVLTGCDHLGSNAPVTGVDRNSLPSIAQEYCGAKGMGVSKDFEVPRAVGEFLYNREGLDFENEGGIEIVGAPKTQVELIGQYAGLLGAEHIANPTTNGITQNLVFKCEGSVEPPQNYAAAPPVVTPTCDINPGYAFNLSDIREVTNNAAVYLGPGSFSFASKSQLRPELLEKLEAIFPSPGFLTEVSPSDDKYSIKVSRCE